MVGLREGAAGRVGFASASAALILRLPSLDVVSSTSSTVLFDEDAVRVVVVRVEVDALAVALRVVVRETDEAAVDRAVLVAVRAGRSRGVALTGMLEELFVVFAARRSHV